ncbi:M4 family metallopeptidase [Flavobacterium sp.]|uniref:M4 family metallopeptidase n=1 Tax=Flavobacterium sp. TaxID=239 RepID=UPI00286E350E|nr:M4 family metallopeptidase [Flavobacterium sp.]
MKKNYGNIVTVLAVSMFTLSALAQETDKHVKQKSKSENGIPSLITFNEKAEYKNSDSQKVFKEQLGLKPNQSFSKIKSEIDPQGFTHEKFQLFHQGIKVEYSTYALHSKNGKIESMSGEFYNISNVKTTPSLSKNEAFSKAVNYIGASKYMWDNQEDAETIGYKKPQGELVLLPSMNEQGKSRTSDKFFLAYKFDIYATNPVSRGDLYIDANTGSVLYYNATIKHIGEHAHGKAKSSENNASFLFNKKSSIVAANAATRYSGIQSIQTLLSGSSYILSDNTRGGGVQTYNMKKGTNYASAVNFTDVNNDWTAAEFNNTNKDNAALDAHWGAEKTFDYFSSTHNRNSYNNSGAKINSYIHYSNAYDNAFWDGTRMTYGDGSGTLFDALTSLDVAAHEIGHAVCETSANLAYQRESGAMNEGFSDIWGACVEFFAAPGKQTWLIGEDIEKRAAHIALRSMSNPKAEGQPDTYGGTNWRVINCGTPTQSNDYCGVHTNSGVLNHWFYILSIGKSGTNDKGSAYNVTGISIDKAAKIAYRLETVYLSANSTFANARTSGIQAATDLYGAESAEVIATTNAWYAVGVGAAFVGGSTDITAPSTPASLAASGTTSSSTNLSWTASTDNVGVTGYNVYNGTTLITSLTGTSGTVSGLTGSTTYSFTIKAKDAAGNLSDSSNAVSVTTLIPSVTYCASKGNNTADERIGKVVFGTINSISTGTAGYENFTAQSTNVTKGTANTITITPAWTSTKYNEGYAVWIDYNKNGLFTDSGELVFSKAASQTTPVSGSITIPSTASVGVTRMRVSMKYNAIPTSCESFTYGQVEDYSVNITGTTVSSIAESNDNQTNATEFNLYPNPTDSVLNIVVSNDENTTYKIYNLVGQEVKAGNLNQNEINVSNLTAGLYIFELNDGQKTITKKFVKK